MESNAIPDLQENQSPIASTVTSEESTNMERPAESSMSQSSGNDTLHPDIRTEVPSTHPLSESTTHSKITIELSTSLDSSDIYGGECISGPLALCQTSSTFDEILKIGADMFNDLLERTRVVLRYVQDDSFAVTLIKTKNYIITTLKDRPEKDEFKAEDIALIILSILAYYYNCISDFAVAIVYLREGHTIYAFITLAVLLFPLIIANVVSLYFYQNDNHECSVEPLVLQQSYRWSAPIAWTLCIIMHCLLMGQIYR